MRRALTVLLAMATVLAGVGPAVAMAETSDAADDALVAGQTATPIAQQETTRNQTTTDSSGEQAANGPGGAESANVTDDSPPGAVLAGVLGAQRVEHEGELERRALGVRLRVADDIASEAQILARTEERLRNRTADLEQHREALQQALENGTMSRSEYRARVTELAAETSHVRTMANRSADAAEDLPTDVLAANGVNVTALQQVRERAGNVTGPQMAEIARQIAGPNVGAPMGPPRFVGAADMNGPGMGRANGGGPAVPGGAGTDGTTGDRPTNQTESDQRTNVTADDSTQPDSTATAPPR